MTVNRLVLFGAASDVACRYVFPALVGLQQSNGLPQDFTILAVTKRDWDDESQFRRHIQSRVAERQPDLNPRSLQAFLAQMKHVSADLTNLDQFRRVTGSFRDPVALYLGLPPAISEAVVQNLLEVDLPAGSRIIMEKPFGQNRQSARQLNRALHKIFPEEAIFRLDHFLGKQTVQNILGVRFANRVLEPVWNSQHVERVEVVWQEARAPEGRIGYYDSAGALKDMIQNHLLQLMCLLAMEPPSVLSEHGLRERKIELLRSIRAFSEEEIVRHTVRGRYTAGRVQGRNIRGYEDEPGVDPDRQTETFAQVRLCVDNPRWMGVPFVLRTGKAMAVERQEVAVCFKPTEQSPFSPSETTRPNHLRLGFTPDRVELRVNVNGPGNPLEAQPVELETELAPQSIPPYASLIEDVLHGNPMLFIRDDEAEEAWRIIDPIVAAWTRDVVPLQPYQAGSDGPSER